MSLTETNGSDRVGIENHAPAVGAIDGAVLTGVSDSGAVDAAQRSDHTRTAQSDSARLSGYSFRYRRTIRSIPRQSSHQTPALAVPHS